jgi:iron complex outermembrane recepter protein
MQNHTSPRLHRAFSAALLLTLLVQPILSGQDVCAAEFSEAVRFDIQPQALDTALLEFSKQSGISASAPTVSLSGKKTGGVSGKHVVEQELQLLLKDSGLTYRRVNDHTVAIGPQGDAQADLEQTKFTLAQAGDEENDRPVETSHDAAGESKSGEVVVTGSHIRGISPDSSPTVIYSREDIERSGAASVEQFVRKIPQNLALVSEQSTSDPHAGLQASANTAYGAGINLRGLGSGSTLVLVNGHRLAPSGFDGTFVDVSLIPLMAIERMEILTDGASAIYGADAVGGVVNFVLRYDY